MPESYLLFFGVFPLWVAAGIADWWLHRRSAIEVTSGLFESLMHLLLFVQMGIAIAAVALLEINAGVIALCIALYLMHEITEYADLRWTTRRREIVPAEQMVHSFLELLPLVGLALLASAHWDQATALFGFGRAAADFTPHWKTVPLPPEALAAVLIGGGVAAACYLEELRRCHRLRKRGR